MLKRVLLAGALSLVLGVFAGHGSLAGGVVHAAVYGPGASVATGGACSSTTYSPSSSGPFFLEECLVGGATLTGPGNYIDSLFQNQVGTISLVGEGCIAASITTGKEYFNPTGFVEFGGYNSNTGLLTDHARCTVQTGDVPGANLFATLYESGFFTGLFSYPVPGSYSSGLDYIHIYETESPTGVVTAYFDVNIFL